MSLQQNNINKLPKHLQHVRLQKEEEEEQWISGEELCTEGSSDEDTNTNDVKKKFKTKSSKESIQSKKSTLSTSNVSPAKESDEEVEKEREHSPTQWRPKRDFDLEMKNCNTDMKYFGIINEIKSFKNHLNEAVINDKEDDFYENLDSNTLDNKLENMSQLLQDCIEDRKNYQKEVCKTLKSLNSEIDLINTRKYLQIFRIKTPKQNTKSSFKQKFKSITNKFRKTSISKNKKMSNTLLNDEEKLRLEFLLSDIDFVESNITEESQDEVNIDEMNINKANAFKTTDEEVEYLQDINEQLKTLQEMCDDADLKGKLSESSIDEENREWKAHLKGVQEKFRMIDYKIKKIRDQDVVKEAKEDITQNSLE